MWGWIRGHKTFATGVLVLVMAFAVSAYAAYEVTDPAGRARHDRAVLRLETEKEWLERMGLPPNPLTQAEDEAAIREWMRLRQLGTVSDRLGRAKELLSRPRQLWGLVFWGGVAGMVLGGALVLTSAFPLHRTAEWMRRRLLLALGRALGTVWAVAETGAVLLSKCLNARGALLLGVAILTFQRLVLCKALPN